MRFASVPLPEAAGPSMAMIIASCPAPREVAPTLSMRPRNSGKLVATIVVSSTVTGCSAGEPQGQKGHGDAVIEVRRDRAAAAARACAAHGRAYRLRPRPRRRWREPGDGRGEPVALLHLELGEAIHARVALGKRGDDRQHRIFVDHAEGARSRGTATPFKRRIAHADVGDRLAALFARVQERDVGAHLAAASR